MGELKPLTSLLHDDNNNNSHFDDVVASASLPLSPTFSDVTAFQAPVTPCLDLSPLGSNSPLSDASTTPSPIQTSDVCSMMSAAQQLPSYQTVFLQPSTIGKLTLNYI